MYCEVEGCRNIGTVETDDGLLLCQSHAEAGVFVPEFSEVPPERPECECDACLKRRKAAVAAYNASKFLS